MEEIWKDIYYYNEPTNEWIDYRGLYQVSNFGRVKSLDRIVNHNHNHIKYLTLKGKYLKTFKNRNGYLYVHLCKDGIPKRYKISRLVYFTFNPDADTKLQVNHIDEDKSNNRLDNFNLMTAKENCIWGTRTIRLALAQSKTVLQFDKNGNFIKDWPSINEAARITNMSAGAIVKCCKGRQKTYKGFIWKYKEKEAV